VALGQALFRSHRSQTAPSAKSRPSDLRHGHATVSITLDTYSHAIPAMQEEAAQGIAELVFAGK
jgi:hypothetical protein